MAGLVWQPAPLVGCRLLDVMRHGRGHVAIQDRIRSSQVGGDRFKLGLALLERVDVGDLVFGVLLEYAELVPVLRQLLTNQAVLVLDELESGAHPRQQL